MAKIDKVYGELCREILEKGFVYDDPNREDVKRIQIPSYTIKHSFDDGFPVLTSKRVYWKGVVGELLWFLKGDTNIKYLLENNISIWNKDAYSFFKKHNGETNISEEEFVKKVKDDSDSENGNLGSVYGKQWRDWEAISKDGSPYGIDQISELIKGMVYNSMGTRQIVSAWNVSDLKGMALPPCHWSFQILPQPIGEGRYGFTLKWNQRSVDTFLGLPFNIASYSLLAIVLQEITGLKALGIEGCLSNVHIYENHIEQVKEQLGRATNLRSPKLVISQELQETMRSAFVNLGHLKFDSIDEVLHSVDINDFSLYDYKNLGGIKAEMIAVD